MFRLAEKTHRTSGTGCGSSPGGGMLSTPSAQPPDEITPERAAELGWVWNGTNYTRPDGSKVQTSLTHQIAMLPTQDCSDRRSDESGQWGLSNFANNGMLPTPRAMEVVEHPENVKERLKDRTDGCLNNLSSAAAFGMLPTPKSRDHKGETQRGEHAPGDSLCNAVKAEQVRTGVKQRLNPFFPGDMMGFPDYWTLAPFVEVKCEKALPDPSTFPRFHPTEINNGWVKDAIGSSGYTERVGLKKRKNPHTHWREQTLKAYGNAVRVDVVLEIFKAINKTEGWGRGRK